MRSSIACPIFAFVSIALAADQVQWGQCGGNGWTGPTTCVNGWTCKYNNDWYSQCLPGTSTTINLTASDVVTRTSTLAPASSTTLRTTTTPIFVSTTGRTTSTIIATTTTRTTAVTNPTTTSPSTANPSLIPGYYWIRAVTDPNYHLYIQANTATAVLGSNLSAGQFAIVNGQLTQLTSSGTILYAQVEQRTSADDLLLGVTWGSAPNPNGAFAFSGDTLTWTVASITRPNPAAWYVCGSEKNLIINLGAYLYGTPAGCTDHTIHYYNNSFPDA